MVVIGAQGTIIQNTGKYADVNGFSPDVGTMSRVPIVDSAMGYDRPISGKTTLLAARNALFVESMDHNLIPPFIMREAGWKWMNNLRYIIRTQARRITPIVFGDA